MTGIAAEVCYHARSVMPSLEITSRSAAGVRVHPLSLRGLLAAQPEATLARLLARRGVEIDPAKQLDRHEQAARALAPIPRAQVEGLGSAAREALEALVARPGWRARRDLGGGALALVEPGLALSPGDPMRELDALVVPAAYRLQLATPRAESRHAARGLLAALDPETRDDVILTLHGRRTSILWPLALEGALLRLESPAELDRLIAEQDHIGLLALSAIEARGGEVGLDEYLDLCRETARWSGARIPRRGAAFLLVANALVLPSGDGRLVMPEEVAARVGRERRATLEVRRAAAIDHATRREDEPQRATLTSTRAPRALAAWLESATPGRLPGRGAIARAARRSAASFDQTLLLVTLVDATPLRGHTLGSYEDALLETWRSGHAWDEILETPRVTAGTALETPTVVLRACAMDALASLPWGRFAAPETVRAAIESDLRFDGVTAAFARGRLRRDHGWIAELRIAIDRLLEVSLPALGLVDVAPDGSLRASARALGPARLAAPGDAPPLVWSSTDRARLGPDASIDLLTVLAGTVDAVADDDALALTIDPLRVPLDVRDRWLATLERTGHPDLASVAERCVRPRASAIAQRASWVITLPDATLATELRSAPEIARWLVAPHPDAPVLVLEESAPRAVITRALARAGVSLEIARPEAKATKRRGRPLRRVR